MDDLQKPQEPIRAPVERRAQGYPAQVARSLPGQPRRLRSESDSSPGPRTPVASQARGWRRLWASFRAKVAARALLGERGTYLLVSSEEGRRREASMPRQPRVLFIASDGLTRSIVGGWFEMYGYEA